MESGRCAPAFVVQDGCSDPIAMKLAPTDLDLGVIGGSGDVGGVVVAREAEIDAKCEVFLPMYKGLAQAWGDALGEMW